MSTINITVNGQPHTLEIDPDTPLLWALRDHLEQTGTKFGCGIAQCGACTVHINGNAMRSCVMPVSAADGAEITTIEGLDGRIGDELRKAWIELNAPQCGYCQSGMLMAAADLLKRTPKPSDAEIDAQMTNICRCGTYPRIRKAIHKAAEALS